MRIVSATARYKLGYHKTLRYGKRTEGAIVRDFLFMKTVLPSNVVARSGGRERIIGTFEVVAELSVLAFG